MKRQRPVKNAPDPLGSAPTNKAVAWSDEKFNSGQPAPNATVVAVDMNVELPTDGMGLSGGIWVLWKEQDVDVTIHEHSNQLVHLECSIDGGEKLFVSGVYGSPRGVTRMELWDYIRDLHQRMHGPWLLCGDFNSIRSMADKTGGAAFISARCRDFNNCAEDCQLMDIDYTGPRFTWFHGQIRQRLDRAVCNTNWAVSFPDAIVKHLPWIRSDHRPILIHCPVDLTPHPATRPFQFVAAWLEHESFPPTLQNA
ncbi:hypothetical protein LINPERHAP2_LOCUS7343 [Linum perenne]